MLLLTYKPRGESSGIFYSPAVSAAPAAPRLICDIARDIYRHWARPSPYAVPYMAAMRAIETIDENYGSDDARGIVLYFLSNAGSWRGDDAKRLKAELKALLA